MEPDLTVLASLRKAVEAMPDDVPRRVNLPSLLLQAGQRDEAIRHVGAVLQRDPGNAEALALLQTPAAPANEAGGTSAGGNGTSGNGTGGTGPGAAAPGAGGAPSGDR